MNKIYVRQFFHLVFLLHQHFRVMPQGGRVWPPQWRSLKTDSAVCLTRTLSPPVGGELGVQQGQERFHGKQTVRQLR